jgi:hypothetical protein
LELCGDHPSDEDDKPDTPAAAAGAAAGGAAGAAGAAAAGSGSGGGGAGGSGSGEWKAAHQFPAVLGIALIAMGEPLGAKMATRALEHLLQYGEPIVRWVLCHTFRVPLVGAPPRVLCSELLR